MEREDKHRERLRATFGEAPALYDRARPGYPTAMFDDLAALAELTAGSRVLEIGAGTGQATLPLAERGYDVTAVELSGGMAAIAKRKLAGFPNARVVTGAFEAMPLPAAHFDAVLCATAWKWLDPAVRLVKAAAVLVPGGSLAIAPTLVALRRDRRAPLRVGGALYEGHLPRPPAHLLRPPRPAGPGPHRIVGLHREPDRHTPRRRDRQAVSHPTPRRRDQRYLTRSPITSSSAICRKPFAVPGAGLFISTRISGEATRSKVIVVGSFEADAQSISRFLTGTNALPFQ
jgi:SAM-dependent methyltransferase